MAEVAEKDTPPPGAPRTEYAPLWKALFRDLASPRPPKAPTMQAQRHLAPTHLAYGEAGASAERPRAAVLDLTH